MDLMHDLNAQVHFFIIFSEKIRKMLFFMKEFYFF